MSRIDDAWKRMTGVAAEPRTPSVLERFALEKTPRFEESETVPWFDEGKVSNFVLAGPRPVEGKPVAFPEPPVSPPAGPDAPDQAEPDIDREKLIDFRQVANYAGFIGRSLQRHKRLAAGTSSLVVAMTVVALALMPKTYHADTKLLAQRNAVMTALSNPGRSVPWDADAPTRAAAETILRRDNLISLIQETNLISEWERTRAPILKAKDALLGLVFRHKATADEKLDQMVDLLTTNMVVVAGPVGDGTVTIDLDWPDAQMAYNLVQAAYQAFLVARQAAETAAINESIGILENYSSTLHSDIDRTVTELQRTKASRRHAVAAARAVRPVRAETTAHLQVVPAITALLPPLPEAARSVAALGADLDDPELPRLKEAIASKRQEIARLEEAHQQQLSTLQAKLGQLMAVYTPTHPSVLTVQHNIDALSQEPAQIAELKVAAGNLETDYQKRVAAVAELQREGQRKEEAEEALSASRHEGASPTEEGRISPPAPAEDRDASNGEDTDFTSIQLRLELNQIMSVLDRTDSARIELAVSQKAFKYRYTVITPAQVPKSPVRPHAVRILGAGLLASLILALVAVAVKDLLSNRILEQWQIERQLGLPVLGTLVNV
jgi:uncharacterized protein involved in exopolysaccharide biosynthesis